MNLTAVLQVVSKLQMTLHAACALRIRRLGNLTYHVSRDGIYTFLGRLNDIGKVLHLSKECSLSATEVLHEAGNGIEVHRTQIKWLDRQKQ